MNTKNTKPVIIQTNEIMSWERALLYAHSKGMYVPNKGQLAILGFHYRKCWTSTTYEKDIRKAYCQYEGYIDKSLERPVIITNMPTFENVDPQDN